MDRVWLAAAGRTTMTHYDSTMTNYDFTMTHYDADTPVWDDVPRREAT